MRAHSCVSVHMSFPPANTHWAPTMSRPVLGAGEMVVSKTGVVSTLGDGVPYPQDLISSEEDDSKQIMQRKPTPCHQAFDASSDLEELRSRHI